MQGVPALWGVDYEITCMEALVTSLKDVDKPYQHGKGGGW